MNRPEAHPDRAGQISEVAYRRLAGEFAPDGVTRCDVIGCGQLAICRVGGGLSHPSCERCARGESYLGALHGVEDGVAW